MTKIPHCQFLKNQIPVFRKHGKSEIKQNGKPLHLTMKNQKADATPFILSGTFYS